MRIYVDFDDVLCETARALSVLAHEMFGRNVPYENILFFNLRLSFSISDAEHGQLMARAHEEDCLAAFEPTPGCTDAIRALTQAGHEVIIVTGRLPDYHSGSVAWLRKHGLGHLEILYVDKYGHAPANPLENAPVMLNLEAFNQLHFDVAIDDAPRALDLLAARTGCRTIIFDRPWNRAYAPTVPMQRACSWEEILAALLGKPQRL